MFKVKAVCPASNLCLLVWLFKTLTAEMCDSVCAYFLFTLMSLAAGP